MRQYIQIRFFRVLIVLSVLFISTYAQEQTVGLFINDSSAFQGYTLFAPNYSTTTFLIDNNGRLVHSWASEYLPAQTAYLKENGNLVRAAKIPVGNLSGGFQEITWDGTVVWEYAYGTQHHDIEVMPNGNVLLVTNEIKPRAECIAAGRDTALVGVRLRSLHIIEVTKTDSLSGEVVWEWRAWDHLIQDYDSTKLNYGVVGNHPELIDLNFALGSSADWLHTNSVAYNSELDQIVVSNRNTNEIWVIDHSTTTEEAASHSGGNSGKGGDLLYRWGNPVSYRAGTEADQRFWGQHDAHWIQPGLNGAGHIMVFNNGLNRPVSGFSSVEEIITPVDINGHYTLEEDSAYAPEVPCWIYMAETSNEFYASKFSGAQRLPNGNTLICSGEDGVFFEITPALNIVWQYINPVDNDSALTQGESTDLNDAARCYRYAPDFPGFTGHDLTPGDPIEIYPNGILHNKNDVFSTFALHQNYPNPFNPVTQIDFNLSEPGHVTLVVYNIMGEKVKTLFDEQISAGPVSVTWDATNDQGVQVSTGVYFYQLHARNRSLIGKMILVK